MSDSMLSRRFSELLGVMLFGVTLIWFVALASYSPAAELEWRGYTTVKAVSILTAAGRD